MAGLHRRFRPHLPALDQHLPGGEGDDAGHDLGQGRFAGAVLADQRVDLAGRSAKSTSSMAGTPAYFFVALRSSRIAPVMAAGSAPTRRSGSFKNTSTALGQHKQGALALHRGDDAVVLAVNAAVQRILDLAIAR